MDKDCYLRSEPVGLEGIVAQRHLLLWRIFWLVAVGK